VTLARVGETVNAAVWICPMYNGYLVAKSVIACQSAAHSSHGVGAVVVQRNLGAVAVAKPPMVAWNTKAGAMLVACRLASPSAREGHYGKIGGVAARPSLRHHEPTFRHENAVEEACWADQNAAGGRRRCGAVKCWPAELPNEDGITAAPGSRL
jgi:hypothetical protein